MSHESEEAEPGAGKAPDAFSNEADLLAAAERYRPELIVFVSQLLGRYPPRHPSADDVVQTAFAQLLVDYRAGKPKPFPSEDRLRHYLRHACHHRAIDEWLRTSRVLGGTGPVPESPAPASDSPESRIEEFEDEELLWRAVGELPDPEREVLAGSLRGLDHDQLAAQFGLSAAEVRGKRRLAIDRLRNLLRNPTVRGSAGPPTLPPHRAEQSPIPKPEGLPVPPEIARSLAAYEHELPGLLRQHPRRWVAYIGGNRARIADTQTELYQYCLNELGLSHDKFIVRCIVPDTGGEVEYTPR